MIRIEEVKDLSKAQLNNEDVMILSTLIEKSKKLIIVPENIKDEDKESDEKWDIKIIAKGANVHFNIGDYIELKAPAVSYVDVFDNEYEKMSEKEREDYVPNKLSVVHMNLVEFAISPENYGKES